jgi:hypothetical protein
MFNDIEKLYERPIITDPTTSELICPVCGKKAKKKETIEKHIAQRNCADLKDVCADTVYEKRALDLYNIEGNRLTLSMFRKSNVYNVTLRFIMFCADIETSPDNLIAYIQATSDKLPSFVQCMTRIDSLDKSAYRLWLQQHHTIMIDSVGFYKANKENLQDENFLKSSIIKGKIAFDFLLNKDPKIFDTMSEGNFILLHEFLSGSTQ